MIRYAKAFFRLFGLEIHRTGKGNWVGFPDSMEDFDVLYRRVVSHTVISKNRLFLIFQFVKHARAMEADMAEVGVFKGGSSRLIASSAPERNVHLFDTFEGIPSQCTQIDLHKAKDFSDTSIDAVRSFLKDCPNVFFYKGIFPATAQAVRERKFSFVHIDVDIYQSVKDCLEFFYPRMVPAAVILLDDYGDRGLCPGVTRAVNEFLADKKEYPIITTEVQCAIIKQ